MSFEPLVKCDRPGCDSRVESWVARCGQCRKTHGPSPDARRKREDAKPKRRCSGLKGIACSALITPPRTRCRKCATELKRRRELTAAGVPSITHRYPRPKREDTK